MNQAPCIMNDNFTILTCHVVEIKLLNVYSIIMSLDTTSLWRNDLKCLNRIAVLLKLRS